MRQDLLLAPMQEPVAIGNIVARSSGERYVGLLEQKREVAAAAIDPEPFMKDVKIDDAAIKAYYDANTSAFQTPELAKIEYVIAHAGRARRADGARPGRSEGAVRQQPEDVHEGRGARRVAHPDRRQARRQARGEGGGAEEGRGPVRAGEGQSGEVRRSREAEFAGSGFGGAGRRASAPSAAATW